MRGFELPSNLMLPPDCELVIRLDGRCFSSFTREECGFEKPFDDRFHRYMRMTTEHLMQCGLKIVYGYFQSDEISLLMCRKETFFRRRLQKICSVMAGEASSAFSLQMGTPVSFDCRVSQLPNQDAVQDYFRWRQGDARRNALNSYCHWSLVHNGMSAVQAHSLLKGVKPSGKEALLNELKVDFTEIPLWQKNGTGMYWQSRRKQGYNPLTGTCTSTSRRKLLCDDNLPDGDAYGDLIISLMDDEYKHGKRT